MFCILAIGGALLLYGNALQAPFYLDDIPVTDAAMTTGGNRPLGFWTFWLSQQFINLFFPFFPWKITFYYRVVNVLIHALAATAVFWLANEILDSKRRAAFAGALFLVHPIQTQAVTYISQRFEALAALFMFAAAASYVRYRKTKAVRWALLCFALGIAGVLSKETVIALPIWLALIEIVFFSRGRLPRPSWYWIPPLVVLIVFVRRSSEYVTQLFSWIAWDQYWLTQGPVLFTYVRLVLLPIHQYLLYDFLPLERLTLAAAAQWLVIAGVVALGFALLRSRPVLGFGILSFFVLLLPVTLMPIPDLIFEHRVYPALAGIAIAAAAVPVERRWGAALAGVVLLAFSARTVLRNAEWNDPLAFFESHARAFPNEPRILTYLGGIHLTKGEVNRAMDLMARARQNENRMNLYYSQAIRTTIAIDLSILHTNRGELAAARTEAFRATKINPNETGALKLLGRAQLDLNENADALITFKRATELKPDVDLWAGLYEAAKRVGDDETAKRAQDMATRQAKATEDQFAQQVQIPARFRPYVLFGTVFAALAVLALAGWYVYAYCRRGL